MHRVCRLLTVVMPLVIVPACNDYDNMREDVLLCEEAAAHLRSCCGYPPSIRCDYQQEDGVFNSRNGGKDLSPDLTPEESRRIMNKDCARVMLDAQCGAP
jgi:hypothetical protein